MTKALLSWAGLSVVQTFNLNTARLGVQPRHYTGKSEAEKQLSALLVRRRQLDEILKAEQNRLRTISPILKSSVQRMIACLKEEKKIWICRSSSLWHNKKGGRSKRRS